MKVVYLEDGVRKSISCDYFNSCEDDSVIFHYDDVPDDFGNPQERVLVTLPHTLIELVE